MENHLYFKNLIHNLKINNLNVDYILKNIINPFTPYYISDFYYGNELKVFKMPDTKSIDLFNMDNIKKIKNNNIIFVQVKFFEEFFNKILPLIKCNFILITGQTHRGKPLKKNESAKALLNDNRLIKWFSQNPIFENEKYLPFPYGINNGVSLNNKPKEKQIINYAKILIKNYEKNLNIINLNLRITHPCRKIFKEEPRLELYDFYKKMAKAKFILSPIGDRDDCYRHWEAIGLGTIPISNVNDLHKKLFKKNMIYESNPNKMLEMYNMQKNLEYKCPNKDLICVDYWKNYIKKHCK